MARRPGKSWATTERRLVADSPSTSLVQRAFEELAVAQWERACDNDGEAPACACDDGDPCPACRTHQVLVDLWAAMTWGSVPYSRTNPPRR